MALQLFRRVVAASKRRTPEQATWVPPGHFYSPIVAPEELEARRGVIFDRSRPPSGIALHPDAQLRMLTRLGRHVPLLPFKDTKQDGLRYYYNNESFGYGDAIILATMLMELRPKRVIEVGSGFSSAVTLDVSERFLDKETSLTFIDPYPRLLTSLMREKDSERARIIGTRIQDIDISLMDELSSGDVLFIDSTHVTKCDSDVNFEVFEILPRLSSGVYIHFHDVFYPFEYPEEWFFEINRSWNELYLLRAFLMHNDAYEIVFFNHYMHLVHQEAVAQTMPLFLRKSGGSLWLRKR
jgi:hypothetical protein